MTAAHSLPFSAPTADTCAAVAECLHVDGAYREAATWWSDLAATCPGDGNAALKAAIAYFALGDQAAGETWLERAERTAAPDETAYVRGHLAWQRGRFAEAREHFDRAADAAPECGKALTARGVLAWSLGASFDARHEFREAARRDARDGEARLNDAYWRFRRGEDVPEELVAEAARLIPHKAEPHVLWSRVLRRAGRIEEADRSLRRARIRRLPRDPVPNRLAPTHRLLIEGRVSIRGDGIALRLRIISAAPPDRLRFRLNRGCRTTFDGDGNGETYRIDESRWTIRDGTATVDVFIDGLPSKPGVSFRDTDIELAGTSAWFPLFDDASVDARLEWDLPNDARVWWSAAPSGAVDALILLQPQRLAGSSGSPAGEVLSSGVAAAAVAAHPAAVVFASSVQTWNEILGDSAAAPPLLVVPRPDSTFCYARETHVRVASGAIRDAGALDLLRHEAGHLWWGIRARPAAGDQWITEGLAESIFHELEPAARLHYRARVIERLNRGEPETALGLTELNKARTPTSAAVLREKGGYFFAMLRALLGGPAYRHFLRDLYAVGRGAEIDAWITRALAAGRRDQCLHWFFAQWTAVRGGLSFAFADVAHEASTVRFRIENRGSLSIGAPVTIELQHTDGTSLRRNVNLELGAAGLTFDTDRRPLYLRADPELDWYAARGDFHFGTEHT